MQNWRSKIGLQTLENGRRDVKLCKIAGIGLHGSLEGRLMRDWKQRGAEEEQGRSREGAENGAGGRKTAGKMEKSRFICLLFLVMMECIMCADCKQILEPAGRPAEGELR